MRLVIKLILHTSVYIQKKYKHKFNHPLFVFSKPSLRCVRQIVLGYHSPRPCAERLRKPVFENYDTLSGRIERQ